MIKSSEGFTLLEVLVTFLIFLIVASMIPQFFKVVNKYEAKLHQQLETSVFYQQLGLDIYEAVDISVDNGILYLTKYKGETVTYAYLNSRIRRQVNGKGHEIVLQNIQNVIFAQRNNGVAITVWDNFDQVYHQRISHLLPLEAINNG